MTTKISELPVAGPLSGIELLPVVQTGTTKNTTVQDIANLASGGGAAVLSGLWDMSAVSPISCTYGLIASEAQVMSLGFAGKLTMSNADQTGSRILSGAANGLAAFPDILSPQTFDLTSGKKVVEWEIVMPALEEETGSAGAQVNIVTATMAAVFSFLIQRPPGSATTEVVVELNGTSVYYDNFYAAGTSVIVGAEFDSATSTARVILDGNVLTLSSDSYAGSGRNASVVFIGIEDNNTTGADIGKTYAVTLRTAASDITQTYGAGAVDICSNPLPASAEKPVGAVAGSIYQISGAGSYNGVSYLVNDLAFFLTDGDSALRIPSAVVNSGDISAAITAHSAATDPHGDRAYADGLVATEAINRIANDDALDTRVTALETSPVFSPVIVEAGTTRTLSLSDAGKYIRTTRTGGTVIIIVPHDGVTNFPVGAEITIFQSGTGQVVFEAQSGFGTTINGMTGSSAIMSGQYKAATLKKVAANTWDLIGALA